MVRSNQPVKKVNWRIPSLAPPEVGNFLYFGNLNALHLAVHCPGTRYTVITIHTGRLERTNSPSEYNTDKDRIDELCRKHVTYFNYIHIVAFQWLSVVSGDWMHQACMENILFSLNIRNLNYCHSVVLIGENNTTLISTQIIKTSYFNPFMCFRKRIIGHIILGNKVTWKLYYVTR